jgi:hypothetical protein
MMSIKKMLLLAVVLTFLFTTASVYAAVTYPIPTFNYSGTQFIVRQHGQNEVVGDLILTSNLTGTSFPAGSQMQIAFFIGGAPIMITNYSGSGKTFSSGYPVNYPSRNYYVQAEYNTEPYSSITVANAVIYPGQAHVLQFDVGNTTPIHLGEVIRVEGIRLDVGDSFIGTGPEVTTIGLGAQVVAVVSAQPAGAFQITNVNSFSVANVLTEFTTGFTAAKPILNCLAGSHTGTVTITEFFPDAFTTVTNENDITRKPVNTNGTSQVAVNGVRFTVNFTGTSPGVKITGPTSPITNGTLTFTLISPTSNTYTSTGTSWTYGFTYEVTADNLIGGLESMPLYFTFALTSAFPSPVPATPANLWYANVTIGPQSGTSSILSYTAWTKPSAPGTLIGSAQTCVTNLLCKFITTQTGFDTGIAIANTSTDIFGTTPQNGACSVYFYGTGGTSGFTNPYVLGATSIPSGQDAQLLISSVRGIGFLGYAIIQCNFQFGHAETIIADKYWSSFSHGYDCLVIPDPNINNYGGAREPSGSGFITSGSGESLGQKRAGN